MWQIRSIYLILILENITCTSISGIGNSDTSVEWIFSNLSKHPKFNNGMTIVAWIHSHVQGADAAFSSIDCHNQYNYQHVLGLDGLLGIVFEVGDDSALNDIEYYDLNPIGKEAIKQCGKHGYFNQQQQHEHCDGIETSKLYHCVDQAIEIIHDLPLHIHDFRNASASNNEEVSWAQIVHGSNSKMCVQPSRKYSEEFPPILLNQPNVPSTEDFQRPVNRTKKVTQNVFSDSDESMNACSPVKLSQEKSSRNGTQSWAQVVRAGEDFESPIKRTKKAKQKFLSDSDESMNTSPVKLCQEITKKKEASKSDKQPFKYISKKVPRRAPSPIKSVYSSDDECMKSPKNPKSRPIHLSSSEESPKAASPIKSVEESMKSLSPPRVHTKSRGRKNCEPMQTEETNKGYKESEPEIVCEGCKTTLPESKFYKHVPQKQQCKDTYGKRWKEILKNRAKETKRKRNREYYQKNQEKKKLSSSQRNIDKNEKIRAQKRQTHRNNRESNLEYKKEYYKKNRKKILEQRASYFEENQDEIRTKQAIYDEEHRSEINAKNLKRYHNMVAKNKKFEKRFESFKLETKDGPNFICLCCDRGLLRSQVRFLKKNGLAKLIDKVGVEIVTRATINKIHDQTEFAILCHSCHQNISSKKIPKISVYNGLPLDPIPEELDKVHDVEQQLFARSLLFMKVIKLPKTGMRGIKNKLINVPLQEVDISNTVQSLPRTLEDSAQISFQLKRKLEYANSEVKAFIRPNIPIKAVEKLIQLGNPHYVGIKINHEFAKSLEDIPENSNDAEMGENVEDIAEPDLASTQESSEENVQLLNSVKQHQVDREENTCLYRQNLEIDIVENNTDSTILKKKKGGKVFSLAPGENKVISDLLFNQNYLPN